MKSLFTVTMLLIVMALIFMIGGCQPRPAVQSNPTSSAGASQPLLTPQNTLIPGQTSPAKEATASSVPSPIELLSDSEPFLIGKDWYFQSPLGPDNTVVGFDYNSHCISTYNLATGVKKQVLKLPEARGLVDVPNVFGDKVVYITGDINPRSALLSGSGKPYVDANWLVSVLDLKTSETKDITPAGNIMMKNAPKIYGDTAVWFEGGPRNRDPGMDVYAYDLKTNIGKKLSSTTSAILNDLVVSRDWVVWRDNRPSEARYNVYAYDLKDDIEKRLTSVSSLYNWEIGIAGDNVVWTDGRNIGPESFVKGGVGVRSDYKLNDDIYRYNLATGQEQRITSYSGRDQHPAIDGNRIVWTRDTGEKTGDVFMYDIKTGQESQVSHSGNAWRYQPAISGNRIVWMDYGSPGVTGIYLYDLNTNRQVSLPLPAPLVSGEGMNCTPTIINDKYIVYSVLGNAANQWAYAARLPQ